MLERVVRRVQRAQLIDKVVVATSTNRADDEIVVVCETLGVASTRGSEDDVLDRFRNTAAAYDATTCVRVCADSPLIDASVCDLAVGTLLESNPAADYASNKIEPSYPLGLDVEAFTRGALERAWNGARNLHERSHVTVHMYQRPGAFRLLAVRDAVNRRDWRWTVDTEEDLEFMRQVFSRLDGRNDFSYAEVVSLIDGDPSLPIINSHVRAKAVTEG